MEYDETMKEGYLGKNGENEGVLQIEWSNNHSHNFQQQTEGK